MLKITNIPKQLVLLWSFSLILNLGTIMPVKADTVDVRCDFYSKRDDNTRQSTNCIFSQRQGFVSITKPDGTRYDFKPNQNQASIYFDQNGQKVTREINDDRGLIFRTTTESIYIYWDNSNSFSQDLSSNSVNLETYITVQSFNNIAIQIIEEEFSYSGILKRTSARQFMGSDGKVRVLLNPYDGHIIVLNEITGTEFYNYYISPISGVGEDPDTMCNPNKEPC